MTKRWIVAFAMLTLCPCDGVAAVNWETSLERGSAAALKANKPMLIEFWANWCPPCLVMDAEVYTDASVMEAMTKVVPVRIDVDKQPPVARKYELTGMPMLVFADSYGNELFRFTGTITAPTMIQLLEEFPGDVTSFNRLAQVLARDQNNFAALASLGRELKAAGLFRSSNEYYGRAMRGRTVPEQAGARGDILIAMGHNHLELKEFREAGNVFERYLEDFGGGPAEPEAMLGLGRALLFQNKRADAKRTLQTLTNRHKTGPAYSEAVRLLAGL
jgi:thiol-disulfide isomerase/thioredoxin